ncbi:MAG: hypothetical protein EP329_24500 [Deltaproteobacteria bacterium]|nr:MAG: hypothetical protein EP329_24500 [Deltaproteobacteria bacterium]
MVDVRALAALLALGAFLGLAGCEDPTDTADADVSDDVQDVADAADADVVEAPPNPLFDPSGEISVVELVSASTGAVARSEVAAHMAAGPLPNLQRFVAASGDCQLWTRPQAACDPPCNAFTQSCVPGGVCEDLPEPRSAGDITITGGTAQLDLGYVGNGLYAADTDPPTNAFDAGATLTVSAAGEDIAAFQATVTGVADLTDDFGTIALSDGSPYTLNWTPAGGGATVEVVLQLGWHANPPEAVITCSAPDSAGSIVIASELVEGFPYFSGLGLFQVPSWIQRVSRTDVQTASGVVTVFAASRQGLTVTHAE